MRRFLIVISAVLFSQLSVAADDDELYASCLKGNSQCEQAMEKFNKVHGADSFYRVMCERFKIASDCIKYARVIGIKGFDDIADGYVKFACRLDQSTCKVYEGMRCIEKQDRLKQDQKVCTQGNPFFKQDE